MVSAYFIETHMNSPFQMIMFDEIVYEARYHICK